MAGGGQEIAAARGNVVVFYTRLTHSRLFSTHNQVRMVLGHGSKLDHVQQVLQRPDDVGTHANAVFNPGVAQMLPRHRAARIRTHISEFS